jgi:uncharacterized protein
MNNDSTAGQSAMTSADFEALETILDDLRTRNDETPQWDFCEGFLAAVQCCRRPIPVNECLAVLLDIGGTDGEGSFADDAQAERFLSLWLRRGSEIVKALETEVDSLADERAYYPLVMDARGALAALPEAERAQAYATMEDVAGGPVDTLPAYAQVWAIGFMFAVESWPEEWAAPRDKAAAKALNEGLNAIVALTEDDTEPPLTLEAPIGSEVDDGQDNSDSETPPGMSAARLDVFASAMWAVYDLYAMWQSLGPRVATVHKAATPGRNDPCYCGSGKKYKKCHGAN